jgi:hypothetical protein
LVELFLAPTYVPGWDGGWLTFADMIDSPAPTSNLQPSQQQRQYTHVCCVIVCTL